LGLLSEASKHLDTEEVHGLVSKSDSEIKIAVIKKHSPEVNLDGKDESYIQARFDIALEKGLVTRTDVQIVRADVRGLACRVGRVIGQRLEKWQIIGICAQLPIGAVGFLILSLCIHSGKQAQTGKD
jgi:hypothetical protein